MTIEATPLIARHTSKAAHAFRTISEVSEQLDIPQHVLRFWETKFPQIKPLKRGGGRRYYRPEDIELLKHIQRLLHNQGYTIKGVQRLLKEQRGADIAPAGSAAGVGVLLHARRIGARAGDGLALGGEERAQEAAFPPALEEDESGAQDSFAAKIFEQVPSPKDNNPAIKDSAINAYEAKVAGAAAIDRKIATSPPHGQEEERVERPTAPLSALDAHQSVLPFTHEDHAPQPLGTHQKPQIARALSGVHKAKLQSILAELQLLRNLFTP
jgi:DNA-binding transcriptional MerR regulator